MDGSRSDLYTSGTMYVEESRYSEKNELQKELDLMNGGAMDDDKSQDFGKKELPKELDLMNGGAMDVEESRDRENMQLPSMIAQAGHLNGIKSVDETTESTMVHYQSRHTVMNRQHESLQTSQWNMQTNELLFLPRQSLSLGFTSDLRVVLKDLEKEKMELQELNRQLNEELYKYIERNRLLKVENSNLNSKFEPTTANPSQIRTTYDAELANTKKKLDAANEVKELLNVTVMSLKEDLSTLQETLASALKDAEDAKEEFERQNEQLKGKVDFLEWQLASLKTKGNKEEMLNKKLQGDLKLARSDRDNETILRIGAEIKHISLKEELAFLKTTNEQEQKEMEALIRIDSADDNRAYWENGMGKAFSKIHDYYHKQMAIIRAEKESSFKLEHAKVQHDLKMEKQQKEKFKREIDILTKEVDRYKDEMYASSHELRVITDPTRRLKDEIAHYRRILEGMRSGSLYDPQTPVSPPVVVRPTMVPIITGKIFSRKTEERSTTGPLVFENCGQHGDYITLKNEGTKDEELGDWSLIRDIDGTESVVYKFHTSIVLRPKQKITVWSKGRKPPSSSAESNVETDQNWGVGDRVVTKLINPAGEERASLTQKTKKRN